jgi:hypothetical protein
MKKNAAAINSTKAYIENNTISRCILNRCYTRTHRDPLVFVPN